MRTSIAILTVTLALTVFLTSLILETRDTDLHRSNIHIPSVDPVPFASRVLLHHHDPKLDMSPEGDADGGRIHKADVLLTEARRFIRTGNLAGAAKLLHGALELIPDHPGALEGMGAVAFAQRDYAVAETHLLRLRESVVDMHPLCLMRLGVAQMRQQKHDEALTTLNAVLEYEPDDGALHFALACIHSRLKHQAAALNHLEMAYSQFGFALLAHISNPDLDSLRNTPKFKHILNSALFEYKQTAVAPAPLAHPPQ